MIVPYLPGLTSVLTSFGLLGVEVNFSRTTILLFFDNRIVYRTTYQAYLYEITTVSYVDCFRDS